MYCLCVNVYCHRVTTQMPSINISISYQNVLPYLIKTMALTLTGEWRCSSIHSYPRPLTAVGFTLYPPRSLRDPTNGAEVVDGFLLLPSLQPRSRGCPGRSSITLLTELTRLQQTARRSVTWRLKPCAELSRANSAIRGTALYSRIVAT